MCPTHLNDISNNIKQLVCASSRLGSPPYTPIWYMHTLTLDHPQGFAKRPGYLPTRSPSVAEASEYSVVVTPQPATTAESDVSVESWISDFDVSNFSQLTPENDTYA